MLEDAPWQEVFQTGAGTSTAPAAREPPRANANVGPSLLHLKVPRQGAFYNAISCKPGLPKSCEVFYPYTAYRDEKLVAPPLCFDTCTSSGRD